jgi:hypothetical protein
MSTARDTDARPRNGHRALSAWNAGSLVHDSRLIRLAGFGLSMALGGAGILIAVLFSIGAFDGSNASAGATGRVGSPAAPSGVPLDAAAIYRNTAPAVTAITATGVTAETGEGKVTAS